MPKVTVDINTRVLSEDHQIFVARPGRDYRLRQEFIENRAVLLELPSLELELGKTIDSYDDLGQRIIRSARIRNWHGRGRPTEDVPPRNLEQYRAENLDRSEAQLQGLVRGLFERAKRGDLVIVPPKPYSSDAYIGEFSDDPTDIIEVPIDRFYPGDPLPGRRVKWLTTVPKRRLPTDLLDAIEKPNVFFLLARSLRYQIYERAYESFSIGDDSFTSKFEVTSADFKMRDDFVLQAFFNFVAVNVKAIDEANEDGVLGLKEAAFIDPGDYDLDLRTNINSPGWIALLSRHVTPIAAAALLALALQVDPSVAITAAEGGMIEFGNSKGPDAGICSTLVREQVVTHLKLLGLEKWTEACILARETARRSGVKSPVQTDTQP